MRKRKLSHGEHLDDVALEKPLDLVQVNLRKVLAHELLRGIVHEDIELSETFNGKISTRI